VDQGGVSGCFDIAAVLVPLSLSLSLVIAGLDPAILFGGKLSRHRRACLDDLSYKGNTGGA